MCGTLFRTFLCRRFARLQRETSRHFLVTRFMEEMSYVFLFTFFFTATHFQLALVAARISHFLTAATKFLLFFQPKMFPLFFISRSSSLSLFFSLSFAGLSTTLSLSLSFLFSIFQICGQLIDDTDTETISAFHFRLYWPTALQDADGYAISRPNNLELHLGCHTCWLSYFTVVCLWCRRRTVTWYQDFSDG